MMIDLTANPQHLIFATAVGILATARAVRLVTSDTWPPIQWARLHWLTWTTRTPRRQAWADLFTCPFCFAPYATAINLGWALWAGIASQGRADHFWGQAWWVVNLWAMISYMAAMVVVRDEPPAEDN